MVVVVANCKVMSVMLMVVKLIQGSLRLFVSFKHTAVLGQTLSQLLTSWVSC